jgi:hypothetical protein
VYEFDDFALIEMQVDQNLVRKTTQLLISTAALFDYRLSCSLLHLSDELRWWVKPRSMAWFSYFLVRQYDRQRSIQHFRMSKESVFDLCSALKPYIERRDTRYRCAIPVEIRVIAALYKLAQVVNILTCSEMFAIGCSIVGRAIRKVVNAVNIVFRSQISWPQGEQLLQVMSDFKTWCHMPGAVGALDCTHIHIVKPRILYPKDYYYYKMNGYSIIAQAVVDSKKRFIDLFVGMPSSTNDSRTLCRSGSYASIQHHRILNDRNGVQHEGFFPYLLGAKGYPLLSWLMVPHKEVRPLSVLERLYNKRLRRGRCVVENAFGLLKMNWRVLLTKSDLSVKIMPDVVYACAILNNLIMSDRDVDVEAMTEIMEREVGNLFEEDDGNGALNLGQRLHGEDGTEAIQARLQTFLGRQRVQGV